MKYPAGHFRRAIQYDIEREYPAFQASLDAHVSGNDIAFQTSTRGNQQAVGADLPADVAVNMHFAIGIEVSSYRERTGKT
jgi:hypothetical protein